MEELTMKQTLAALQENIDNGIIKVIKHTDSELIIRSHCPEDNDTMLGLAMCIYNEEGTIIVTGDDFWDLSLDTIDFTMQHERAHVLYGHRIETNSVKHEIEADMYGVLTLGKDVAIKALYEIKDKVKNYMPKTERLKHIIETSARETSIEMLIERINYIKGVN